MCCVPLVSSTIQVSSICLSFFLLTDNWLIDLNGKTYFTGRIIMSVEFGQLIWFHRVWIRLVGQQLNRSLGSGASQLPTNSHREQIHWCRVGDEMSMWIQGKLLATPRHRKVIFKLFSLQGKLLKPQTEIYLFIQWIFTVVSEPQWKLKFIPKSFSWISKVSITLVSLISQFSAFSMFKLRVLTTKTFRENL